MDFTSIRRRPGTVVTYSSRRSRLQRPGSGSTSHQDGSLDIEDSAVLDRESNSPKKSQPSLDDSPSRSSQVKSRNKQPQQETKATSPRKPSQTNAPDFSPKPSPSSSSPSRSHLPKRPSRPSSPSPSKLKKSPTTKTRSPRKSFPFPSRPTTPTIPAKDLGDIFQVLSPRLPQEWSSDSQSQSQSASINDSQSQTQQTDSQSATDGGYPTASERLSKRIKLSDRMARRHDRNRRRESLDASEDGADSQPTNRSGSLRRSKTDPFAGLGTRKDSQSINDNVDIDCQPVLASFESSRQNVDIRHPGSRSEPGSPCEPEIEERPNLAVRQLAGLKQTSASNAKRTYGLHRSFLADKAEESLLSESQGLSQVSASGVSTSQTISMSQGGNIEDEIESQICGGNKKDSIIQQPGFAESQHTNGLGLALPAARFQLQRESYSDLLKKWGGYDEDIEWDESQNPTNALKSITSLRSVGEFRRFNGDLEYVCSGLIATQTISVRRSSAFDFVQKLCGDPDISILQDGSAPDVHDSDALSQSAEFLRKLKATDNVVSYFDLFTNAGAGEGTDEILDITLALFVSKLLKSPAAAEPLLRDRSNVVLHCLRSMLMRADQSVEQNRRDGFVRLFLSEIGPIKFASRAEKDTLDELRSIARLSKLFLSGSINHSLRNLVLGALCSLVSLPKRLSAEPIVSMLSSSKERQLLEKTLFYNVISMLKKEGSKSRQRLIDFSKGLDLLSPSPYDTWPDLDSVDLSIRFMDRCMDCLYIELESSIAATPELVQSILQLLEYCIQAAPFDEHRFSSKGNEWVKRYPGKVPDRALQILHGLTKWLLDLSQIDPNWSRVLASCHLMIEILIRILYLGIRNCQKLRAEHQTAESMNGSAMVTEEDGNDDDDAASDTSAESGEEKQVLLLMALSEDIVHLSLALLTNLLIQKGEVTRETILAVTLHPYCWGLRACAEKCVCENKQEALVLLSQLFFDKRKIASIEDDANAGYLANSIATAIAQFAIGSRKYLELLQGVLDRLQDNGFETLLQSVEEFARLHQTALDAERLDSAVTTAITNPTESMDTDSDASQQQQQDTQSDPIAAEAGELIEELAISLRRMARGF